ncbi:unnamed protein product, partial [Rotaria magnacalcarata]
MHRKAVRAVELEELKNSAPQPSVAATNITQQTRTNSNSDGWERDPGSDRISAAVPLLPINKSTSSNEQATL